MGAGLALQIRRHYPKHYEDFLDWKEYRIGDGMGTNVITQENEELFIAGLCAQLRYGRLAGETYTRADAFRACVHGVKKYSDQYAIYPVYFPWKIGCGLGGGDWGEIQRIIREIMPDSILCKLGG